MCLKLVCELDQTWKRLYELDASGQPELAHRERFQIHSWMTADMLWTVIFPYEGDSANTTTPHYQLLWKQGEQTVWERTWIPEEAKYGARKYPCDEPFGTVYGGFSTRGCSYGLAIESWLAGGRELEERSITVISLGLLRSPNIAVVPADPSQSGVWLDVFRDDVVRDIHPDDAELYRRHDCMLLARNALGEPEVREWRQIVLADPEMDGRKPQEITVIARLSYSFFEAPPEELHRAATEFAHQVDRALSAGEPEPHATSSEREHP